MSQQQHDAGRGLFGACSQPLDAALSKARRLIKAGAPVDWSSREGFTPLGRAAENGCVRVCELLLKRGAAVNAADAKGTTALHAACSAGNAAVAKLLLSKGADVHAKACGIAALHLACAHGAAQVVELLLDNGAAIDEPVRAEPASGMPETRDVVKVDKQTPLMGACHEGHLEVVWLVLARGADINAVAREAVTPLSAAAAGGRAQVVRVLLSRGARLPPRCSDKTRAFVDGVRAHAQLAAAAGAAAVEGGGPAHPHPTAAHPVA